MKKFFAAAALCLLSTGAFAQLYPQSASDLTPQEAQELFQRMKADEANMGDFSECFQRAHLWSYAAERAGINTDKAFVYFTYKFRMKHQVTNRGFMGMGRKLFTWWFHVAPTVRVNGEVWALDATFTDRAMPVQEWMKSLQANPEECVEMTSLTDYREDRNLPGDAARETCYYSVTPKYIYQPLQMGLYERNGDMQIGSQYTPTGWDRTYLKWAVPAYTNKARRSEVKRQMGI